MTTTSPHKSVPHQLVLLCLLFGVGVAMSSCQRPVGNSPLSGAEVARVGDQMITVGALQERIDRRGAGDQPAAREQALRELIEIEAAAAKARRAGYEQRPEIREQIKRLLADRFKEEQLAHVTSSVPPDAEIEEYYQTHHARFANAEKVRGAVIYLRLPFNASSEKVQEIRSRAEKIRAAALNAHSNELGFGVLAQQNSDDQITRYRGGDLGCLTSAELAGRLGSAAADALFALRQPDELSPLIEQSSGFYLFKLIARQPETSHPLAEVRAAIIYLIQRDRQAAAEKAFAASCTNGLAIQINRPLLERPPSTTEPESIPSLPGVRTASAN
jgi:peptidyl-prolyl cis-trans isomerase C